MRIELLTNFSLDKSQKIEELIHAVGWNKNQIQGQLKAVEQMAGDPDSIVLVVSDTNHYIGFATCQYYAWNRLSQIHGLIVHPECRRMKIASKLVGKIEEEMKAKSARGVYVDTPTNNTLGRNFYKSMDYIEAYIMPKYYDAESDGVTYQKFF